MCIRDRNRALLILQQERIQETEQGLYLNQGPLVVGIDKDPERDLKKDPYPLLEEELKRSLLGEEILDLHLRTEEDLGLHPLQEYVQTPCGKEE